MPLWLSFELKDADAVIAELQATPVQVRGALSRAANRTASILRTRVRRYLVSELQVQQADLLRKRLRSIRIGGVKGTGGARWEGGARLWIGLNPIPVGWIKGRAVETAKGASLGRHSFDGGFVANSKYGRKKRTIFRRQGEKRTPIQEQTVDIDDRMRVHIEDNLVDDLDEIFWAQFVRDLQARVKFKIGERRP